MTGFLGLSLLGTVATRTRPVLFGTLAITTYAYRSLGIAAMAVGGVLFLAGAFLWSRGRPRQTPADPSRMRERFAVLFLLAGLVTLSVSLYTPWWSVQDISRFPELYNDSGYATYDIHGHAVFLPGDHLESGCTVDPPTERIWGPLCNLTISEGGSIPDLYSTGVVPWTQVGQLYGDIRLLLGLGVLFGALAAVLRSGTKDRPRTRRRARTATACLIAALLLVALSPIAAALLQPGAYAADRGPVSPPSPGQSFWGTCGSPSAVGCSVANETTSWGPGLGWYLSIAAAILFVAALVPVVWRPRKRAVTHEAAGLSKEGSETPHEDTQDIEKLPPATRLTRGPVRIPDVRRLETPTHSLGPRLDPDGTREARFGAIFRGTPARTSMSLGVRFRTTAKWNPSSSRPSRCSRDK